jgi:putative membrane protein
MITGTPAILQSWSAPIGVNLVLILASLVYARGWLRLRTAFPNLISAWRLAAFFSGIVAVWAAIGSPLAAFDDVWLTIHMAQHLLLMSIAPPLILLGEPALPLLRGLPESVARNFAGPFLRWGFVKSIGHAITNPAICWLAATLALIGWHLPAVFELALRWNWLHELEHACFFGSGILFWWPVVQPWPSTARWPRWSIPLYLFSATLPCDVLSAFLAFCDRVVYASYLSAPRPLNISAFEDQQCAAAVMWVCVTIILLVPAVIITMQILAPIRIHPPKENSSQLQGISSHPLTHER